MRRTTIGKARNVVTLAVEGAAVPDGDGGYTEGLVALVPATWYCAIDNVNAGLERQRAGTVSATATHRLRGRFHPEISVRTRITFLDPHRGGAARVFAVESVETIEERGGELEVVAHEVIEGTTPATAAATGSEATR
jgi:head-tail adaptor